MDDVTYARARAIADALEAEIVADMAKADADRKIPAMYALGASAIIDEIRHGPAQAEDLISTVGAILRLLGEAVEYVTDGTISPYLAAMAADGRFVPAIP